MNTRDFDILEALVRSGKEEFLLRGFEGASLRAICRKAGVTTGAFYAYFDRKEALFSAIVEPMLADFRRMYDGIVEKALEDVASNGANELEAIEFTCAHRDEFRLLFDCSGGTKYAGFSGHLRHRRSHEEGHPHALGGAAGRRPAGHGRGDRRNRGS